MHEIAKHFLVVSFQLNIVRYVRIFFEVVGNDLFHERAERTSYRTRAGKNIAKNLVMQVLSAMFFYRFPYEIDKS